MTKKTAHSNLRQARKLKKDEFFTQFADIESEIKFHKDAFKNKVVYCNCDDPKSSQFIEYFSKNFQELALTKLLASWHKDQSESNLSHADHLAFSLAYYGEQSQHKLGSLIKLKGDGDFRSEECIELLKQADIVVTNPPFSLFREFISQLEDWHKKYLIIGNVNAITYKETFKLIKENKLWLGASIHSGDREFAVPDDYPLQATNYRVDSKGKKFIRVKGIRWFTNLDYEERYQPIVLTKSYSPQIYPQYDNYDAINVDRTKKIPFDYPGIMGVPITFLDKYNPEQFEIIGLSASAKYNPEIVGIPFLGNKDARPIVNGEIKYARIFIKNKFK